jgi:carbamoyltransferase
VAPLGRHLTSGYQSLGGRRKVSATDSLQGSKLGPAYSDGEVEQFLQSTEAVYTRFDTVAQLTHGVAELLAEQAIVGWFQGRMEFGPRALGGRSILGDPRADSTQKIMNLKTKHRESFRPFAPSVLAEHAADYFDLPGDNESPYMLLVAQVAQAKRLTVNDAQTGFEQLYQRRSTIPAVTHVDYSARVQTVDRTRDPLFHELISAFHQITGCPMVVNTSFNIRGEPIVCSPEDAYRCFMATHMDVLVMGSYVLRKSEQPEMSPFAASQYRDSFELD